MPKKPKVCPINAESVTPEFILAKLWAKRHDIDDMVILYTDMETGRGKLIRTDSRARTLCFLKEILAWDIMEMISEMEGPTE